MSVVTMKTLLLNSDSLLSPCLC